jgi:hydrophobic/amphiphilic exporter-1 (mainly G- bacteria), HAE1 family
VSLPAFGVRRPVVANLLMFALLVGGLVFGSQIRREFFPQTDPTMVLITAPYPGAAPDEVERALATKIEDAIRDLRDIKEVSSTVAESVASVRVEFESGVDIDVKVADVKREVDALQDLPEAADRIVVRKIEPNLPAIILSLYGESDERTMKRAIRKMRDDLRTLPGMGQITVGGVRTDEIRAEVRPEALLEHGLSLPAVSERVRAAMVETPAGVVRSPTANVSVRTPGAEERADAVSQIVVKAEGERVVRLGDIAEVAYGFVDVDVRARLNGLPAVSLTVFQVGDQDAVKMAEMVKAYAAGLQGEPFTPGLLDRVSGLLKPPGERTDMERAYDLGLARASAEALPGRLAVTTDLARFIVGRLQLLTRNALQGGVLVFLVLFVFLNWRVSFWVILGMLIALSGTLVLMRVSGITLNLLTMFGLIIVVGILVDDAIVVAENIVARHEGGESPDAAAVRGAEQVAWPVVGTVVTTVLAFFPLTLVEGRMGDLLSALPLVVGCALLLSLVESLFILPVHMAHSLGGADRRAKAQRVGRLERIERRFDRARDTFFARLLLPAYTRLLRLALRRRYVTLAIGIAAVTASAGMVAGGRVGVAFLVSSDSETINGELRLPVGTPASVTDRYVRRIEEVALAFPEVKSLWAIVGAISNLEGDGESAAPHISQIILELTPVEERSARGLRRSDEIIVALRRALEGDLVGIRSFRLEELQGGGAGPPISLGLVGDDPERLAEATASLIDRLNGYEGVFDVSDDKDQGQMELRVRLRDGASDLGFTTAGIAAQVRGAVFGLEPYTFAGQEEDVDVRVVFPARVRRDLGAIESMHVFTPSGVPVPLAEVAEIEQARSFATVRRLNGRRIVTVTADNDDKVINADEVTREIFSDREAFEAAHPGVRLVERGTSKDMKEAFGSLPAGFLVALGLIYVCLAWLFQSYTQPLIVLAAVPFAIIGVIWGHLFFGFRITFLSMIGFIALAGIVVNDSLIFVKFFNRMREMGMPTYAACIAAGRARLRAILLTTVTTVCGLLPMLLEQSFQARFLIPMAITISCGLISATALILVLLPSLLMILADVRRFGWMLWRGELRPAEPLTEPEDLGSALGAGAPSH